MSPGQLNSLLQSNVIDVRFARRRPRPGVPPTRRMLCTLDSSILNSVNGRTVLNYSPPGSNLPYDVYNKGLCMAWDIIMQDFRMISSETASMLNTYPGDDTFWEYFNQNIQPMSTEEKTSFMNT